MTSGPYTGLYIRSKGIRLCEGEQSTIRSVQACHSAWHDLVKCCLCCWWHKPCHPTCHAADHLAAVALTSHSPSTTNCGTLLTMRLVHRDSAVLCTSFTLPTVCTRLGFEDHHPTSSRHGTMNDVSSLRSYAMFDVVAPLRSPNDEAPSMRSRTDAS